GEPIGKFSSFFGKIPLVTLSPQDIKLTSGVPYDKRRNFDVLISQTSRIYYDDLRNLNRIITQKNSLLKENLLYKKYSPDELKTLLEPWNNSLIEYGVKILLKRIAFMKEFRAYIKNNFKEIVGDLNIPEMYYFSSITDGLSDDDLNEININDKFREKINQQYQAELRRGMSIVGPHRDNYVFRIMKNGQDFELKYFGSQGEQKTFLVALKLSEYQYLRDKLDKTAAGEPILLLDDLFSELDKYRAGSISTVLPEFKQVFLTTTNADYLELIKNNFRTEDISVINVANGTAVLRN
ncbi:MAG: DNA replication/repair protein RecF, partial [Ignavibacteria bacterium]